MNNAKLFILSFGVVILYLSLVITGFTKYKYILSLFQVVCRALQLWIGISFIGL